jgi:integrase
MKSQRKSKNPFLRPGSNVWWIRYTINGKQERESTNTTVYADAVKVLDRRKGEIATGKYRGRDIEQITLGDLLRDLEKDYIDRGCSSLPALRAYQKHLLPALGHIRASRFGTDDFNEYRHQRVIELAESGGEKTTINREVQALRAAWNLALRHDPPKVNRHFHFSLYDERWNVRTGFLEEAGYQVLKAELPNYLRPLLVVGYFVPCRLGELRDLEWRHVEFAPAPGKIVLDPGTTKNKLARAMGLIGEMRETLLMQKSIRDAKFPDCPYVFFNDEGGRIGNFRKAWASACKRSGVAIGKEDQTLLFHDLRRSAARNMRRAGIDRSVIKRIGGWKTEAMFLRYNIVDERDFVEAALKMESYREQERNQGAISTEISTVSENSPTKGSSTHGRNLLQ